MLLTISNPLGKRNPTDKALKHKSGYGLESEPALKRISGLHQVWRHNNARMVPTKEAILGEGEGKQ